MMTNTNQEVNAGVSANMICIDNGTEEKSLLNNNDDSKKELIENTYEIIETV